MATGRTTNRWTRVYIDGYDVSGVARTMGPLECTFDDVEMTALADSVKTYLPNHPNINCGTLDAILDNTAIIGLPTVMNVADSTRTVTVVKGIQAVPAIGDPSFCGSFRQSGYRAVGEGGVYLELPFSGWAADAATRAYPVAWGKLLHTNIAATAANASGTGVESATGASTLFGGYMVYHVTAANAVGVTATIKVQHSDTEVDGDYVDLGGCTTGVIDVGTAPVAGILPTTTNVTQVLRYTRWQIVLGTATSVTFVLTFMRGIS